MSTLSIKQIPALRDNYMYLITCEATGKTAVVDPAEATPVAKALAPGQTLDYILNTHHHWDHTDGNLCLKEMFGCEIIGSGYEAERIPGLDTPIKEKQTFNIGNAKAEVLFVPGHTSGHIAFYFPESDALFCGDSLFAGGCGRIFEGTPEDMFKSLQKLANLPPQTKVYCGHEYTQTNYAFAHQMAPESNEISAQFIKVKALREEQKPTVPSTIKQEKQSNIFMLAPNIKTFTTLRKKKDQF